MNLKDINNRLIPPVPWREGEKIPWHDSDFSKRMLKEHLNQNHDMASRNFKLIDKQVRWISDRFLQEGCAKILDLGCGPGFYTERFAQLGHQCTGIDLSPASIAYAKSQTAASRLQLQYHLADLRDADFGSDQSLVIFIFGEFNVFSESDARRLLMKAYACMRTGAVLLVECSRFEAIRREGLRTATWHSHDSGLWSESPYIVLEEHYWDDVDCTTTRYFILDLETGSTSRYTSSSIAYTETELSDMFCQTGFSNIEIFDSLSGDSLDRSEDLQVIAARK